MKKRGIYQVFVFLITLIICDFIFGIFSKAIFNSQKSGKYARLTYIVKTDTSAIIVLGSSHAMKHYDPEILQDSLHESVFNYGTMGQKLLFNEAIYEIRESRSIPKMIILNVDADWFFDKHNQQERMSDLFPYYNSVGDIIFKSFSRKDKFLGHLKLLSKTFPYNSTVVHVIKYKLKPQYDIKGYAPLYEVVDSLQWESQLNADKGKPEMKRLRPECDSSLVKLFSQFIDDINRNNIRLFVVISPDLLKPDYPEIYVDNIIKEICNKRNTPLFDFSNGDIFNNNRRLFSDFGHLNDSGARMFTRLLTDSIKLKIAQ